MSCLTVFVTCFQNHLVHRGNLLDRLVCQVRDCATKSTGFYPVSVATGAKDNACFSRRKEKASKTKARLNPEFVEIEMEKILGLYQNVADNVHYLVHDESSDLVKKIAETKNSSVFITSEDLFQFESDFTEKSLETSVSAWIKVFEGWSVPSDENVVRKVLLDSRFQGFRPEKPHSQTISNSEDVFEMLKSRPEFLRYFRH